MKYVTELELETHKLIEKLFNARYVDLRPIGGESAVAGVIMAFVRPGDTVFETGIGYGGQMAATRFLGVSLTKNIFHVEYWPYDIKTHQIDVEMAEKMIREKKPSLLIMGRAQILFPEPVRAIKKIAEEIGACVAYDASHVFGLIAGKRFPNPLDDGADILLGSHTKTFPGPQGGMALTNSEETYYKMQGGRGGRFCVAIVCNYHMHRIASLAAALVEMEKYGEAFADQVIRNSQALAKAMYDLGFKVLYPELGFSKTHMVMVDVTEFGGGTKQANLLEEANIFVSDQSIPIDLERGTSNSGLRIGTQEVTRTGMKEGDMGQIAHFFKRVIIDGENPRAVSEDVAKFMSKFNRLSFSFDDGVTPYEMF
jgi:glycine hydroxymethyltransferase